MILIFVRISRCGAVSLVGANTSVGGIPGGEVFVDGLLCGWPLVALCCLCIVCILWCMWYAGVLCYCRYCSFFVMVGFGVDIAGGFVGFDVVGVVVAVGFGYLGRSGPLLGLWWLWGRGGLGSCGSSYFHGWDPIGGPSVVVVYVAGSKVGSLGAVV